jgi:hypothetical protein
MQPFQGKAPIHGPPRVARRAQPWAERFNPFGIAHVGPETSDLIPSGLSDRETVQTPELEVLPRRGNPRKLARRRGRFGLPHSGFAIVSGGGQPFPVRAEGDGEDPHRLARHQEQEVPGL